MPVSSALYEVRGVHLLANLLERYNLFSTTCFALRLKNRRVLHFIFDPFLLHIED